MKQITLLPIFAFLNLLAVSAYAQVLSFEFDFDTLGDTEGWTASAQVQGLTVAKAVQGDENVLTSSNITGNDPQLYYNTTLTLPEGATWYRMEARFRQLDSDPPNGSPIAFGNTGTMLQFNSTNNTRMTPLASQSYTGAGGYSSDTYVVTLTEQDNDWVLMSVSFVDAPILSNQNITQIRFEPLGGNADLNFEVDYVRFYTVIPESSNAALLMGIVGLVGLVGLRRHSIRQARLRGQD